MRSPLVWIFSQFFIKSYTTVWRLAEVLLMLPTRILRLMKHLGVGVGIIQQPLKTWELEMGSQFQHRFAVWWTSFFIYFLECFGIGELYETLTDVLKFNTRPLSKEEVALAKTIYGDNLNYNRVRIDQWAAGGPKQMRICYVSFYLINSWGTMRKSTLIHELMHVWQYEKTGAVYMLHALRAQHSTMGYNYGGVTTLKRYLANGKNITDFNPEQQADIVTDYFLIKNGQPPQWGSGGQKDLGIYKKFIEDLGK